MILPSFLFCFVTNRKSSSSSRSWCDYDSHLTCYFDYRFRNMNQYFKKKKIVFICIYIYLYIIYYVLYICFFSCISQGKGKTDLGTLYYFFIFNSFLLFSFFLSFFFPSDGSEGVHVRPLAWFSDGSWGATHPRRAGESVDREGCFYLFFFFYFILFFVLFFFCVCVCMYCFVAFFFLPVYPHFVLFCVLLCYYIVDFFFLFFISLYVCIVWRWLIMRMSNLWRCLD
jgi:hypothetical protein